MSPLSLRRHRAERLLRQEFEGLRGRVLASVHARLRASGVSLDLLDLEACYAQAWQGLYAAVMEGQEIANPGGWLVLVTFRRAIEEHRARARFDGGGELRLDGAGAPRGIADTETFSASAAGRDFGADRDFATELDDRVRLRQLFEALRGRLHGREREAAALCYLQGFSRAEAAARMGISDNRMRKLMEGRGPGYPGVAAKVGALVETIRDGDWCAEQGSLMRALAYGILDPGGERHQLALMHHSQCPACRAYVVSLRGLAAVLPPVLLPGGLGAAILARAGEGVHAGAAAGASSGGAGLQAGGGLGGALSASGAAGAGGAAGGGWLLGAGPLGAKLAVGCLLALGVGAGCIALDGAHRAPEPRHRRQAASRSSAGELADAPAAYQLGDLAGGIGQSVTAAARRDSASSSLTPSAKASREFGPEQALAASGTGEGASTGGRPALSARSASSGSPTPPTDSGGAAGTSRSEVSGPSRGETSGPDSVAAEREFSPE